MVIILIGISGSGKTTFSRDFILKDSSYLRISSEDIVQSMVGNDQNLWYRKDVGKIEKIATDVTEDIFKMGVEKGYNIIIDADNISLLKVARWIHLTQLLKQEFKIKFIECSLATAIRRLREKGKTDSYFVINQMNHYQKLKNTIIKSHFKNIFYEQ